MAARILASLLLATLIAFSCTEDDEPIDVPKEQEETESDTVAMELDSNFQHCDSVYIRKAHWHSMLYQWTDCRKTW